MGGALGIVVALGIGVVTGTWLRSRGVRPGVGDVAIGIAGAVVGAWLIAPLIGGAPMHAEDAGPASLFATFIGSVALLALATLLQTARRSTRTRSDAAPPGSAGVP